LSWDSIEINIWCIFSVFAAHYEKSAVVEVRSILENFAAMSRVALKSVMMINDFDNFRKSVPVEKNCIG